MTSHNIYPFSWQDNRDLNAQYSGDLYVWDIDQTYLQTLFFNFWDFIKIPFESALDKRAHSGMPEILRGLRRGPGPGYEAVPLYFISASPSMMRPVLEKKMLLDGVEQDGIILKDYYRLFWKFRPRDFFHQLAYKLSALMELRLHYPLAHESLFGDDVEHDSLAYSLYSCFLNEEKTSSHWEKLFLKHGLAVQQIHSLLEMKEQLGKSIGQVDTIYIYRTRKNEISEALRGQHRFVLFSHPLHLAIDLYYFKKIDWETIQQIVTLLKKRKNPVKTIENVFSDLQNQGDVSQEELTHYKNRVFKALEKNYNNKNE